MTYTTQTFIQKAKEEYIANEYEKYKEWYKNL